MYPPGCHHNGFMATPELGHRMYGYTCIQQPTSKTQYIILCVEPAIFLHLTAVEQCLPPQKHSNRGIDILFL